MTPRHLLILLLGCTLFAVGPAGAEQAAADAAALWRQLRQGDAAALMRHALAPGTGDPAGFAIDDCGTQRNLSAAGRAQARAVGESFRRHGIETARVYSSQWCRCLDTARLLDLGEVQPLAGLNSFFRNRSAEPERTAAVLRLIQAQTRRSEPPLVLVTHQVNITALTEVFPDSGEVIVVRPEGDGLAVLGRIQTR